MTFLDILNYGFIQRAIIAGVLIAVLCSTLGLFLVLRRLSLIGDGLAHVTFGSVAIGMLLKVYPPYMAIPFTLLGGYGILKIIEKTRIYGDSAIGIISSAGIAVGILITSITGGFNVDLFSYLFGNILTIKTEEVLISIFLTIFVIGSILIFYNQIVSTTFDEDLAKVSGIKTKRINTFLILVTAITVVIAMRMVGILLVSSFLILPNVSALQIAKNFKSAFLFSYLISIFSVIFGIIISIMLNLPTGATIVLFNLIIFTILLIRKTILKN